jgi:excisionase family DNA binding protein
MEPLITAADVGVALGNIPAKTIRAYARDGRLPAVWIGRHLRFFRSRVMDAVEQAAREGRPI